MKGIWKAVLFSTILIILKGWMKCNSLLESFGSLLFSDFIGDFIDVAESSYKYFWELSVVRVFPIIEHWGNWAQCYVIYLL